MGIFLAALIAVAILLLTATPGYIFIKKRMISRECIPGLSKILLYVCQSSLVIYTFASTPFSVDMLKNLGIFMIATVLIHAVMLIGACLILRKKFSSVSARISTIATTFANSAFFGIPIIEAVMGEGASELIIYTTVYAMVMNLLGWTAGSAIISKSRKYISVKKLFINPYMISVIVALPLFIFSLSLPAQLENMLMILGKSTTPVSMLIIGMRLATSDVREVFGNVKIYATALVKLAVMPLLAFAVIYFFPLPPEAKQTFYIICSCPTASIVLNFSEIIGEGQKEAAASVLLSTILSIATLPLMMLLLPLL